MVIKYENKRILEESHVKIYYLFISGIFAGVKAQTGLWKAALPCKTFAYSVFNYRAYHCSLWNQRTGACSKYYCCCKEE